MWRPRPAWQPWPPPGPGSARSLPPRGTRLRLCGRPPRDGLGGLERFLVSPRSERERAEGDDADERVVVVDHRQPPDLRARHGLHGLIEVPIRVGDHRRTRGALTDRRRYE